MTPSIVAKPALDEFLQRYARKSQDAGGATTWFAQIGSLTPIEAETAITPIARLKGREVNRIIQCSKPLCQAMESVRSRSTSYS